MTDQLVAARRRPTQGCTTLTCRYLHHIPAALPFPALLHDSALILQFDLTLHIAPLQLHVAAQVGSWCTHIYITACMLCQSQMHCCQQRHAGVRCHITASFSDCDSPRATDKYVVNCTVPHCTACNSLVPCICKAVADYSVLSCKKRVPVCTAGNLTGAVVGMTGEHAVQHAQGQAGAAGPCVQKQEQGADQDV